MLMVGRWLLLLVASFFGKRGKNGWRRARTKIMISLLDDLNAEKNEGHVDAHRLTLMTHIDERRGFVRPRITSWDK